MSYDKYLKTMVVANIERVVLTVGNLQSLLIVVKTERFGEGTTKYHICLFVTNSPSSKHQAVGDILLVSRMDSEQ